MNQLSNINTLACGPTADDPFAFVLLMVVVIIFCVVAAVCSIFG